MPNIFQSLYRVVNDNPGTEKLKGKRAKEKEIEKERKREKD